MSASLLIRGARVLGPDLPGEPAPADIRIGNGLIAAIGALEPAPGETVLDAAGLMAAPGLINAHMHSQSALLAGFADCVTHPVFMLLTQAHTARLTPEEIRLLVLFSAMQMIETGTTAAIDHFPGQRFTPAQLEAALSAWEESGLRVLLGVRFFDEGFADIVPDGGGAPVAEAQPLEELREILPETVRRWHGRAGRLAICPAPSNPDRCSDAALVFCADLAARHDLALHTHLLETKRQSEQAQARHGTSSLGRLERLGVLSDRWSCAHAVWLDEGDIARMARHRMVAVHNPESNARIGAGAMRTRAMLAAGVPVALGTDGVGANDNLSMHEAMRAAALLHRASEPDRSRWISARDAFAMATTGGAAALRLKGSLGMLAPGQIADLVLYRLDSSALLPLNDAVAQLVHAESGRSVDSVIVGGRLLMHRGRLTAFDGCAVRAGIPDLVSRIRARNADLFRLAARLGA